jgi:hypothetical protein
MALAFTAVAMLSAGDFGPTILIDDFNDGNADGWEELDFTGIGIFHVVRGQYVLETTEPIAIDDPSVGTLDADWVPSEDEPLFANGTIRGTIRANTHGTTVGFLMRDSHATESDYGFFGSTGFGTFYIERFEFGAHPENPQTILAMADPDLFPFQAGEDWNIEGSVVGHKLEMRAWRVGDPRPAAPMLTVEDKVLGPESGTTLAAIAFFDPVPLMLNGVEEVRVSATVDNITFIPGKAR